MIEARDKHSLQTKADMLGLIQMILEDNFSSLLRNERPVGSVAKSVKDFLDRNSEGELTLDHIAELFSYSKSYLDRCFVREYGIPIMKYRNMRRMARAKLLLGNHSVGEVAEMLGFSSIYAFSRAFRDHVGMSPTAYRHHTERTSTD